MSTIGFIGGGNMAGAIIAGILEAKLYLLGQVIVSDIAADRLDSLAEQFSVKTTDDNIKLVDESDVVVLSVKPQVMGNVLSQIAGSVKQGTVVISIAAGITTAQIILALGDVAVIRVMPNTPALIGEGASALYCANATEQDVALAVGMFSAVGKAVVVESEDLIDAVTAISGSGPAYYFLMMEAMIETAKRLGLSEQVSLDLVYQTAKGAAMLAEKLRDQDSPADLRRKVTSPGGTTEAAINYFTDSGFSEMVNKALTAARDRGRELSK